MAQTILAFGLHKEKLMAIRQSAQKNGIQVKEINRKDYTQKLGALAGIQGFPKEKKDYTGPEFPLEMVIFSGMDTNQVDTFLADYKKTGTPSVPLKAILTPHNIFWTAEALFQELWKEHLHFHNKPF